jgi:lipoyl-dependent peroxiredoxin subunit C
LPDRNRAFGKLAGDFADRDTVVYGVSIDSEFVHLNWRLHHDELRSLPIPMLADVKRELATAAGVLDRNEGVALRGSCPKPWCKSVDFITLSGGLAGDVSLPLLAG